MFKEITIWDPVGKLEYDFPDIVDLYTTYVKGYFSGAFCWSDAPVIILDHQEWVHNPKQVIDAFELLGLKRNDVEFVPEEFKLKDKHTTRGEIIIESKKPKDPNLIARITQDFVDKLDAFITTGIWPRAAPFRAATSSRLVVKEALFGASANKPPESDQRVGYVEGSPDRVTKKEAAAPRAEASGQVTTTQDRTGGAGTAEQDPIKQPVTIDESKQHWAMYVKLTKRQWVKSVRNWIWHTIDPDTKKDFTNPNYNDQDEKEDKTGTIRSGQPRPAGVSSYVSMEDAYERSNEARYTIECRFAEILVAHPELYDGIFPNGRVKVDFLKWVDLVLKDESYQSLTPLMG